MSGSTGFKILGFVYLKKEWLKMVKYEYKILDPERF